MEQNKKKPFKLQSLMKLNNRIVESNLRDLAKNLVENISKSEQLLKAMANKDNKLSSQEIVDAITTSTAGLINALQILTPMGIRQWEVVNAQQGLTYKSEQDELEKLFKIITLRNEDITKAGIAQAAVKAKSEGKTQCECLACTIKRAAEKASKSEYNTSEPKEKSKKSAIKDMKVFEIKVEKGASISDAIEEAINKIKAGELK